MRVHEEVIGGPGAFMVVAEDITAFARAIMNKLFIEIAGVSAGERLARNDVELATRR